MGDTVVLYCFDENAGSNRQEKLRMRVETDGWNSEWNCSFPKDLRVAGQWFEVPAASISSMGTHYAFNKSFTSEVVTLPGEAQPADMPKAAPAKSKAKAKAVEEPDDEKPKSKAKPAKSKTKAKASEDYGESDDDEEKPKAKSKAKAKAKAKASEDYGESDEDDEKPKAKSKAKASDDYGESDDDEKPKIKAKGKKSEMVYDASGEEEEDEEAAEASPVIKKVVNRKEDRTDAPDSTGPGTRRYLTITAAAPKDDGEPTMKRKVVEEHEEGESATVATIGKKKKRGVRT